MRGGVYMHIVMGSDPENWVKIKSYHATVSYSGKTIGYVNQMTVGETSTLGKSFRSKLNLRSSAFDVVYDANSQTFQLTTYGYGHGCGLSQVGAMLYAQQGWTYKEILCHYYTGVTIK